MENLTRRDLIKGAGLLPIGFLYFDVSCTSAQANQFINILNEVAVAVEGALPVVGLLTGSPIVPVVAGFVNIVDSAASKTATELASSDPASTQAKDILGYWVAAVLDPSVISQLPTNVKNVNTQALIQSLVNAVNSFLTQIAASVPAASVKTFPSNVIVRIQIPAFSSNALSSKKSFPVDFAGRAKLRSIKKKLDKYAVALKR